MQVGERGVPPGGVRFTLRARNAVYGSDAVSTAVVAVRGSPFAPVPVAACDPAGVLRLSWTGRCPGGFEPTRAEVRVTLLDQPQTATSLLDQPRSATSAMKANNNNNNNNNNSGGGKGKDGKVVAHALTRVAEPPVIPEPLLVRRCRLNTSA